MPIYTDILPQITEEIKSVTLKDLIQVLPEILKYPINVWIADKIARFGITTGNIIFLVEQNGETSSEMKQYFSSLVKSLGIQATASSNWKNNKFVALRLYNDGKFIIDKDTFEFKSIPTQTKPVPVITVEDLKKFPKSIKWNYTIWLTGGIVRNGWSANDIDLIIFENINSKERTEIKNYFTELLGWKTDVGSFVMEEREPVYLYKLYEDGQCQL